MIHFGTFELWKMRDGRVYARLPSDVADLPAKWYRVTPAISGRARKRTGIDSFLVTEVLDGMGDQLTIEFSEERRKKALGSLFGPSLD